MQQLQLPINREFVSLKPNYGHALDMAKQHHILAKCYDKRGRLLAAAFNSYTKSHPLQSYFARKVGHSEHKIYLHAEIHAILKCRGKAIHRISVERYDAQGLPVNAQPCPICQEAIRAFGIKIVGHT